MPVAFASSTKGFRVEGSSAVFPLYLFDKEIACPLRFISHGMIIGFLGDPARPMVEAIGMPNNMWVAWISPLERASLMAAQLAPLLTTDLIPYFLKRPFSCAMTMEEQSVSAIMPNFTSEISGASFAKTEPNHPAGRPLNSAARPTPFAEAERNRRRVMPQADSSTAVSRLENRFHFPASSIVLKFPFPSVFIELRAPPARSTPPPRHKEF
jgi:hypothetical protein